MKTVPVVALALALAACEPAQSPPAVPPAAPAPAPPPLAAARSTPLTLTRPPPLAKEVEAFPRISTPVSPYAARINLTLAAADSRIRAEIADCKTTDDGAPEPNASWERNLLTKMGGPAFLSLLDSNFAFCGGAYPNAMRSFVTFDLSTGAPIDWASYLPADLTALVRAFDDINGLPVRQYSAPALIAWYRQAALAKIDEEMRRDCAEAYAREDLSVVFWLDAKEGGLGVQTDAFPHAIQACAETVILTTAELRRRGAKPALTDAIDAAHEAGVWAAKPAPARSAAP